MAALMWDQVGDRRFETGIDRGVLFLTDGRAVPWNGLTGIDDASSMDANSFYLDGVKYLERFLPGDFSATLKAFTYPDEFNEVIGVRRVRQGLYFHGQKPKQFHLCYRTRIGNDIDGVDHGYRLHILYNLVAKPSSVSFDSLGDKTDGAEFSWELSSTPPIPVGLIPTTHISIDSTTTDPDRLAAVERLLYGTDVDEPRLPPPPEFTALFEMYDTLVVVDNGDGTWTATDLTDSYITMTDPTTFRIDNADATFLDPNTYQITTTNAP